MDLFVKSWITFIALFLSGFAQGQSMGSKATYTLDQHWITRSQNGQKFITIGALLLESGQAYRGFDVRFSLLANHGGHSPSRDIGDGQIVSNIDTDGVESIKFYELYASRRMGGIELSAGWRDLSTLYNVTDVAQLFINSSFGSTADWGATGFRGPSIYPQVSFGAQAWVNLSPHIYWGAAVADPLTPENYYPKQLQIHVLLNEQNHSAVSELGYKKDGKFHIAFGGWNLEQAQRGNRARFQQSGYYGMLSGTLAKRFSPFIRYGASNDRPGLIYENRVAGINLKKLFAKKQHADELGIGYTGAFLKGIETQEEIYELIYRFHYTPKLSFALSSQYVINPFFANEDGQILTLRVRAMSQNQK